MKKFKYLSMLFTLALALVFAGVSASTEASADKGPNVSGYAYVAVFSTEDDAGQYVFNPAEPGTVVTVEGISYNESTNTLTIKDYNGFAIVTNEMGDDFKVNVEGASNLARMIAWGYGYGGSVTFTGNGTLNISDTSADGIAFAIEGENSASAMIVEPGVTLNLSGGQAPFAIFETTIDKDCVKLGTGVTTDAVVESYYNLYRQTGTFFTPNGGMVDLLVYEKDGKTYYGAFGTDGADPSRYLVTIYDNSESNSLDIADFKVMGTFECDEDGESSEYKLDLLTLYTYYSEQTSVTFSGAADDTPEPAKKGDIITDEAGSSYKVTAAGTAKKSGTVTFNAPKKGAKTVDIPATITVDGITYKVTAIASKAFYKNSKVTSVTIGSNVKTIGSKAFYKCTKLAKLTIKTTKLTSSSVKSYAFKSVKSTVKVTVPSAKLSSYKKLLAKKGLSSKAVFEAAK